MRSTGSPAGWIAAIMALVMIAVPVRIDAADDAALRIASKQGTFADVRADVEDAIINLGLKIDFNGRVGDMLKRTGADVGSVKAIYTHAEYFAFCSAALSRAAMEADPSSIGFCPYTIFVYERAEAPGTVYFGYRRPALLGSDASRKAIGDIEKLLEKVIAAVAK